MLKAVLLSLFALPLMAAAASAEPLNQGQANPPAGWSGGSATAGYMDPMAQPIGGGPSPGVSGQGTGRISMSGQPGVSGQGSVGVSSGGVQVGVGISGGVQIGWGGQINGLRNGLPPTTMDSFVFEAAENAENIYGDEGTDDVPPFEGFTEEHRINAGIFDRRAAGLTTGHGSMLPNAWGADEFTGGPEFSQSGSNGPGYLPPL